MILHNAHPVSYTHLDVYKRQPEACTTWKAMYNGINELIDDLMDHISLENNVPVSYTHLHQRLLNQEPSYYCIALWLSHLCLQTHNLTVNFGHH